MTHRIAVLAACILAAALPLHAQVVAPERGSSGAIRENLFGLGVAGGAASGLGLSFRHHLPSVISYEINGGVIKVDDRMLYDIGGQLQVDLSRTNTTRFFVAGAFAYYYAGTANHNEMSAPERVGLGLGGEMYSGSGLHATLELIFTYFADATVLPLPQVGVHYYF